MLFHFIFSPILLSISNNYIILVLLALFLTWNIHTSSCISIFNSLLIPHYVKKNISTLTLIIQVIDFIFPNYTFINKNFNLSFTNVLLWKTLYTYKRVWVWAYIPSSSGNIRLLKTFKGLLSFSPLLPTTNLTAKFLFNIVPIFIFSLHMYC